MALFSRGDDRDTLIRRLETRAWRGREEKEQILAALGRAELKSELLVRLLQLGDSDVARFAVERLSIGADVRRIDLLLNTMMRLPEGQWKPLIFAIHSIGVPIPTGRIEKIFASKKTAHRIAAAEILAADAAWHEKLDLIKIGLRNDEEKVRHRVVRILRKGARHPNVYPLLRDLLHSGDDVIRHGAIEALAENPDEEVLEEFFDLLPDEPARIQDLMIRGLARMMRGGGPIVERGLDLLLPLMAANDGRIREAAAKLLASMPDKMHVLRQFLHWTKGIAFWLRDRAFTSIVTVADDLAESILQLLREDDFDVVVGAIVMAGRSGDPRVVPGLSDLVRGDKFEWWVKITAIENLAEFEAREARIVLLQALDDDDMRPAAMASLAAKQDPMALPRLLEFLDHPKRGVRLSALEALHHYEDPAIVPQVEQLAIRDLDNECRLVALELLDTLGSQGVAAAASIRESMRQARRLAVGDVELSMVNEDLNE